MSGKVYLMWGWDDEDDCKVVLVCGSKEIAEQIATKWRENGWDHTEIEEREIIEKLEESGKSNIV